MKPTGDNDFLNDPEDNIFMQTQRPIVPSGTYTVMTVKTNKTDETERVAPFGGQGLRESVSTVATNETKAFEQMNNQNKNYMDQHGSKIIGAKPMEPKLAKMVNMQADKDGAIVIKGKFKRTELEVEIAKVKSKMKKLLVAIIMVGAIAVALLVVGAMEL